MKGLNEWLIIGKKYMNKVISILIPTYNEEENVKPISEALISLFNSKLPSYDFEIVFIDNNSIDCTRDILRELCKKHNNIKCIFNAKNFGQFNSPYYGLMQTNGDCTILLCCDFQDPIELIPKMIYEWEKGNKIIAMEKTSSNENKLIYFFRSLYYKIIKKFSHIEQLEHFTGFGLYDKTFINSLKKLKDPKPFLRGIVAELGSKIKIIEYKQEERRAGKTHNNFFTLYDAAMISFTSYTKIGLRVATFIGIIIAIISFIFAIVYLVLKLIFWNSFVAGMSPILIGMFFLGSVVLFFLGVMGEYIMSINERLMNRPLVIEEERINFSDE